MSQTISVGVVGPSYWLYLATVMAERLEKVATKKRINAGDFPEGASNDALEFFRLALQAAGDNLPQNPPASVNACKIAADAVRGSVQPAPKTRRELKEHLCLFSSFVDDLQKPHKLNAGEVKTAKALSRFFLRLQQDGEAEAYEQVVYLEEPSAGFRFF